MADRSSETFALYRVASVKKCKTSPATWRPAGGPIRFVTVGGPSAGRSYFGTDISASVTDILARIADRFSLEVAFRECEQVVGVGRQQMRSPKANVGAFHVCLWPFTMTEGWAWGLRDEDLVDRSVSPRDKPSRRPSHADKRRPGVVSCGAMRSVRLYARGHRGGNAGRSR